MAIMTKISGFFNQRKKQAHAFLMSAKSLLMKKVPELHLQRTIEKYDDVTVVYNMSSLDALLSAALLRVIYPKLKVVTLLDKIPKSSDAYIWIGIHKSPQRSFEDLVGRGNKMPPVHIRLLQEDMGYQIWNDFSRPISIFECIMACLSTEIKKDYGITLLDRRIGIAIALFEYPCGKTLYGEKAVYRQCTTSQLMLLYKVGEAAERVFLNQPQDFKDLLTIWSPPIEVCKHDAGIQMDIIFNETDCAFYKKEQWFRAKSKLTKQYQLLNVKDQGEIKRTVTCSLSGLDYIFVRQGVLLQSYPAFINMAYGANGSIVDTNITDIHTLPIKEDFHLCNAF